MNELPAALAYELFCAPYLPFVKSSHKLTRPALESARPEPNRSAERKLFYDAGRAVQGARDTEAVEAYKRLKGLG